MNADQIAEIRPAIREAIESGPDTCVTLNVAGEPHKWIQVVDRTINAAYPHGENPAAKVTGMQPACLMTKVVSWESGKFATFEFAAVEATTLAQWADAYFVHVLSCAPGEYHVDVTYEQL